MAPTAVLKGGPGSMEEEHGRLLQTGRKLRARSRVGARKGGEQPTPNEKIIFTFDRSWNPSPRRPSRRMHRDRRSPAGPGARNAGTAVDRPSKGEGRGGDNAARIRDRAGQAPEPPAARRDASVAPYAGAIGFPPARAEWWQASMTCCVFRAMSGQKSEGMPLRARSPNARIIRLSWAVG